MSLTKVIEVARGELGYTENPAGSNRVKYWEAYDPKMQGSPWCAAFLWWCFERAGERMAFCGGDKTASCSILLRWYKERGLTVPVSEVRAGDIVLLNFGGGQTPEHCGLAVNAGITAIMTIEGNTTSGNGSQDNGGMVCQKTRYLKNIVGVCRPQYKIADTGLPQSPAGDGLPEGAGTGDDITGHWAEEDIRRCLEKGLLKGYPDGSFQPDKPVTRAELAAVLQRLETRGKTEGRA